MSHQICVVGMGYIGLPTAILFADKGFQVHGVDVNPQVVGLLSRGATHILNEPDLKEMLKDSVDSGRLTVGFDPVPADLFLICVPTPFKEEHRADLSYVEAAMRSVLPCVRKGNSLVLESTSPPGTTEKVIAGLLREKGFEIGKDVYVAYCPERVIPGNIMQELRSNDRTVGGVTPACAKHIGSFYREMIQGEVMETSAGVAEVVKLVENSFRDVNIAFANEMAMMCADIGVDHKEVIRLANHHPRVKVLTPGPGVGGHCIAVDPWFLVEVAPLHTRLIRTGREVNLGRTRFVIDAILKEVSSRFKRTNRFQEVFLFGMTYKPNVSDFRESPAIEIYHALEKELGNMAKVSVVDPFIVVEGKTMMESVEGAVVSLEVALGKKEGGLKVLLVPHHEFRSLGFDLDFSR